jgi:ferritin-like metal-binding protein YciE
MYLAENNRPTSAELLRHPLIVEFVTEKYNDSKCEAANQLLKNGEEIRRLQSINEDLKKTIIPISVFEELSTLFINLLDDVVKGI